MKIPLMRQAFYNEEFTKSNLADFILTTTQFSMGEKCFEFERKFAEWHGMRNGILVNSGASANLALLQALKNLGRLKDGDEVGFSAVTWSTNVMPIIQMGFIPVPLDCNIYTLNVMSHLIRYDLKCVFLTNVLGLAGDLDKIKKLCDEHNVILLEDNCEALGTELVCGNKTGTFGLASTFSFFVGHHLSTIEGGMILTSDPELADMLRLVRANGWDRNLSDYCRDSFRSKYNISSKFQAKYTFYDLAFNIRPTEITGFLGLEQMRHLDEIVMKRHDNFTKLKPVVDLNHLLNHLKKISAFAIPFLFENRTNYIYCFEKNGIEVRPIIAGNITKQPFWKKYVKEEYYLPGADYIHKNGFYCANRPDLTEEEIALIADCAS